MVLCVSSLCRPTDLDEGHGGGRISGTVLRDRRLRGKEDIRFGNRSVLGRMLQAFTLMEYGGVIYGTEIMGPGESG